MADDWLLALRDAAAGSGHVAPGGFVGCTDEELAAIVVSQGVDRLPEDYRRFMAELGHGNGRLLQGSQLWYPRVLALKGDFLATWPEDAVASTAPVERLLVCFGHQSYTHTFFVLGDDPRGDRVLTISPPGNRMVEESGGFRAWITRLVSDAPPR